MRKTDVKIPVCGNAVAIAACDELLVRALGTFLLEHNDFAQGAGYRLGEDLLRDLSDGMQFDLLLLDERLKDMTAELFMKRLCELGLPRRPAVFVLTGGSYAASRLPLRGCGVDGCLLFPQQPEYLAQSLRSFFSGRARLDTCFSRLYRQWGVEDLTANCAYLTEAVTLYLENSGAQALLRKQLFADVAERHHTSLPAVESSLQRLIVQLRQRDTAEYRAFVARYGLEKRGLTPLRLVKAAAQEIENTLEPQKEEA